MNANVSKSNTGKLLVAVLAMAMIFAGAAIVFSDSEVNAVAPTEDPFDGMYVGTGASYNKVTGEFSVTENTTIKLTKDVGSPTEPLDMYISIDAGKTLTISGNYNVYITNIATSDDDRFVVVGNGSGAKLALDGGVDAYFQTVNNTVDANNHVFCSVNLDMKNDSSVTMTQSGTASKGLAFYNGNDAGITAVDSTIVLNNANGVAAVMNLTDSEIQITNPKAGNAFVTVESGSEIAGTTVTIPEQDFSDNAGTNLYIKGTSTIESSDLNLGNSYLVMVPGAILTATGTTIDAEAIALRDSTASTGVTIAGGTINADFDLAYPGYTGLAATGYTLNGTAIGNSTVSDDVDITVGTNGVVVNGIFDADGNDVSVTANGNLVAAKGSNVTLPAGTATEKIYAAPGSTVSGVTLGDKDTMAVTEDTIALYDDSGMALTAIALTVSDDVTLSNGTTLTVSGGLTISSGVFVVDSDAELRITGGSVDSTATGASITGRVVFGAAEAQNLGADDIAMVFEEFMGKVTLSGDAVTIEDADAGVLTIISGNASIANTLTSIPTGVTLNIQKGVTVTIGSSTFDIDGTLNQYGRLEGAGNSTAVTVNKGGIFNAMSGATFARITVGGEGTINMSGAMNDAELTGVYSTDTPFALNQNMVVSGTLTVTGQATLIIQGGLEIPEGTTVYIEEGSSIVVMGGNADVLVAGSLNIYETGAFIVQQSKSVKISGTVVSEEGATISIGAPAELTGNSTITSMGNLEIVSDLKVGATSTLNIQGFVEMTGVENSGAITFDNATLTYISTTVNGYDVTVSVNTGWACASEIQMSSNDAQVNIISMSYLNGRSSLTISDSDLKVSNTAASNDNSVKFTAPWVGVSFENIIVTEVVNTVTEDGKTVYNNYLDVSGNAAFDQDGQERATGTIEFGGDDVRVTGTLNVDENLTISVSGELTVSGTMTLADGVTVSGSEITVTGKVSAYEPIESGINAIYYRATSEPRNIYTSLATAVEDNSASTTVVSLTIMGTVTVTEDVDVPATIRLSGDSGSRLQVGTSDVRGITVDFADGAEFRGTADVDATMHFANYRNDRGDITSDVTIENGNEITYTNVATALAGAQPNDVVTITGQNVEITSDITVPEQVTLVVPIGSIVTVYDGVTVTVDGTIDTQTGLSAQTAFGERADDNSSRLVVNGVFKTTEAAELSTLYTKYAVSGAYYQMITDTGMYKFIQPVDDAAASEATAITIYGENTVGDIAFTGTEDEPVIVTIAGAFVSGNVNYDASKLTAGTITLTYATLQVNGGFDGIVGSTQGSVEAINATGFTTQSREINDELVFIVSGTVNQFDNGLNAEDAVFTVASGEVTVTAVTLSINTPVDFTVTDGATLTISGANSVVSADAITVEGTLDAENGGAANITKIYVLGTFNIGAADNTNGIAAGTSKVEFLYVGVDDKWNTYEGAAVNADTAIASVNAVYVAAGNTISEAQTDGKRTTAYTVQGSDYMDVYTSSNFRVEINSVETPVLDGVYAEYWQFDDNGTLREVTDQVVGDVPTVSAYIIEDVYYVTFTVESGISDVYVDGDLVATSGLSGGVLFVMLPTGEHTVTYRLDNGFSGTVRMTINGEAMTDGKFTLSADMPYLKDDVDYHNISVPGDLVVYNIVITGVEATGPVTPDTPSTGGDDSLGLTDYLLIVLVILIVVMAIIVALRLMRS